jgi:two-component system chemotaxis sensor kinase CheA
MNELRDLFFESASELVQNLNEEALQLEKSPRSAETARSLRRIVHTLKGDSAACGFRELSELAHEFEDVLTLENPSAAPAVPEVALRVADVFAAMLEAYQGKGKLPSSQSLREEINRLAHQRPDETVELKKTAEAQSQTNPWSEYENLAIAKAVEDGKHVHHVTVQLDPQCGMPIAARQMIQVALAGLGEVLAFYPGEGNTEVVHLIQAALISEKSPEQIRAKCRIPTIAQSVELGPVCLPVQEASASDVAGLEDKTMPAQKRVPDPVAPDTQVLTDAAAPTATGGSEKILRVDAERVDSVLNLVGELILAKSILHQTVLEFGQRFPKDSLRGKFSDALAFQARVLTDLQRSVMKIRMVPVDQLFRRFPRTVRDVARQCGKEVEVVIRGGDTDLDKGILDGIAEPLMHLLRNAVGHGIELPSDRTRAGKRAQGILRLNAYHQGNQVVIEVADDGRGIDAEKVRRRAIAQKVVTSEEAARLTESETLELILRPGFSTAEEITELSGRGIGLDVVQSVLNRLKGTVQIETTAGRGTTFRLRLPLTLAILRALLFRVEQRLYALPLNAVAEITRTTEEQIHEVEHYEVLQLRNDVLPLLRLGAAPEPGSARAGRKVFVLVINHGDRKFGLIVNELTGEGELVIKALDDQSIKTDLVSGASILGDGRVVLILNLIALVERFASGRQEKSARAEGLLSSPHGGPRMRPAQVQGAVGGRA